MPADKLDYAVLLSDLEAKKAALEASIASIRAAMALGALGQAAEGVDLSQVGVPANADLGAPVDLPRGALHGKSIPQAIKIFLGAIKKRQTNKQIADALREHGVASTGNLDSVVTGSLNRMRGKEVLRFEDGWGLSSWYSDTFIAKIGDNGKNKKTAKTAKVNRGQKRTAKPSTKKQAVPTAPKPKAAKPEEVGTQDRILKLLNSNPHTVFSAQDVTGQLGLRPQTAPFVLGKLAYRQLIDKTPDGKFRALSAKVREMAAV
jgi:hypothetical protein